MIDRIYNMVRFICNSVLRGNVTPHEYELALYKAMIDTYDNYFYELSKQVNRLNRGLTSNNFADVPEYLREKIRHYLTTASLSAPSIDNITYSVPSNVRHIDGLFDADGNEIEPMENSRQFKLLQKMSDAVINDSEYPVYLFLNNAITVYPELGAAIVLTLYYLRKPAYPKWTYDLIGGNPVFNPSILDFQDVDMHISEENTLVLKALEQFGVNLKESELAQYAIAMSNQEEQTENAT